MSSKIRMMLCAGLALLSIPTLAATQSPQKATGLAARPLLLAGGKAMDCQECADTYCDGDKTCDACEPICKKHGPKRNDGAAGAMENASSPVPGIVSWSCECDDGSGDGGFSEGSTRAEAIKSCKAMNHGHGKVGSCSKDDAED